MKQFTRDDHVEILCERDKIWKPGVVLLRWAEVDVGSLTPSTPRTLYDVEGCDEQGPWDGRFTEDHIREPDQNP